MTRKRLRNWVIFTVIVYVLVIIIGVILRIVFDKPQSLVYQTYKDFILLVIAIPAAWLGACFQRRSSYLRKLRDLWTDLNEVIQESVHYTHLSNPSKEEYGRLLTELSIVIDGYRSVYKNLEEGEEERGYYPLESIKTIYGEVSDLGFGNQFEDENTEKVRQRIIGLWKSVQKPILNEFDRVEPTYFDSPYVDK